MSENGEEQKEKAVVIDLRNKTAEELMRKNLELEKKAGEFDKLKKRTIERIEELGGEVDEDSIQTLEDLQGLRGTLNDLQRQAKGERRGGSGTAPLSYESGESGEPLEFESYQQLMEYLTRMETLGDIAPERGKEAKAILDELYKKSLEGLPKVKQRFEVEAKFTDEEGKEIGIVEYMNREARKRALERKKAREESE